VPAVEALAGLGVDAGVGVASVQVVDVDVGVVDYDCLVEGREAALGLSLAARAGLLDAL
jgi:hypothetical protein